MNIRSIYRNKLLLPEDCRNNFEPNRKTDLNLVELIGLEAILIAFIHQYEEEAFGEAVSDDIGGYIRYVGDCVDILDGVYDTYIFGEYAIDCLWMTENGIPILSCYKLEIDEYSDPFEIVRNTDWMSESKHVLFRLD